MRMFFSRENEAEKNNNNYFYLQWKQNGNRVKKEKALIFHRAGRGYVNN
ncbi:hypothetical protein [Dickeya fangzhongdai]|nr:hypothetical protein [Dickeya fangzhongdai]MBO8133668.1 hypothetical protein [Dickeya fangzhongdai]